MIQSCYDWICENGLQDDGGAKFCDFCNAMCISDESYYRWIKNDYPLSVEFVDAIKKAKQVFRENLTTDLVLSLAKSAKGYTWKKSRTEFSEKNGKPIITKKIVEEMNVPPNTAAAIFLLTNLDHEHWQNRQNVVSKETRETCIKVDADAEILNEIPIDVLADITETLQLAMKHDDGNEIETEQIKND